MTPAAPTAPTPIDHVDHLLRQIETAWVSEEFDAIIAANWPTEPPEPPPSTGPTHPEPPRPKPPAPPRPGGQLIQPQAGLRVWARQRAPPRTARDR
jgi:hypothetical protein